MAKRKPKYDPEAARAQERAQEHANWLDLVREDQTTTNLHTPAFTTPATCPCGCGSQAAGVAQADAAFEAECQRADDWEYRGGH